MIREILFRGKRLDNGEWVYGNLVRYANGDAEIWEIFNPDIYTDCRDWVIIPETVGQFTGRWDKNNVKIFEGDICKYRYGASTYIGKVVFNTRACIFEMLRTEIVGYHGERGIKTQLLNHIDKVEVIGNVHDNPELLEVLGND